MNSVSHIFYKLLLTVIFSIVIFLPNGAGTVQAQGGISVTLNPGECSDQTISATLGDAPIPKLDILFLIDVSESMETTIDEIEINTEQIVVDVRALVPDTAFGLATFIDYPDSDPDLNRDPSVYPWRYDLPLTQDTSFLKPTLGEIEVLFGGRERTESYLRALNETTEILDWREDSKHLVILFGDGLPHDPDIGADQIANSSDDLELKEVLAQLNKHNITILSVYVDDYYGDENLSFHEEIAIGTGGQVISLQGANNVTEAIQQLVEDAVTTVDLTLKPTATGEGLLQGDLLFSNVAPEENKLFTVKICAPVDAVPGSTYSFDLLAEADGRLLSQVPVIIQVPVVPTVEPPTDTPIPLSTPIPPDTSSVGIIVWLAGLPWWAYLIPILLLLLLLLLFLWWWKNRQVTSRKVGPPPSRPANRKPDRSTRESSDPGLHHGRGRRKRK